jgi:hypothetical protein
LQPPARAGVSGTRWATTTAATWTLAYVARVDPDYRPKVDRANVAFAVTCVSLSVALVTIKATFKACYKSEKHNSARKAEDTVPVISARTGGALASETVLFEMLPLPLDRFASGWPSIATCFRSARLIRVTGGTVSETGEAFPAESPLLPARGGCFRGKCSGRLQERALPLLFQFKITVSSQKVER